VAVRLQDALDAEALTQLEQLLVFVGGVEEDRLARGAASDHEHVVLVRPDHHLVDLDVGVAPVQGGRGGSGGGGHQGQLTFMNSWSSTDSKSPAFA
jgi:hypothetical protein